MPKHRSSRTAGRSRKKPRPTMTTLVQTERDLQEVPDEAEEMEIGEAATKAMSGEVDLTIPEDAGTTIPAETREKAETTAIRSGQEEAREAPEAVEPEARTLLEEEEAAETSHVIRKPSLAQTPKRTLSPRRSTCSWTAPSPNTAKP